ncbi:ABC transporter transmembrane domain-containing protein, partial [Methylobacterium oxalidis]|uniref:ABC transporter transmembrane domain-containing protein n=2 Tax=Methylobacterium oxalidis TaxID=944322 RepID=UPI0024E1098F
MQRAVSAAPWKHLSGSLARVRPGGESGKLTLRSFLSERTALNRALSRQRLAFAHAALISLFLSVSVLTGSIFVEQVNDRVMVHKHIVTLVILFGVLVLQLAIAGVLTKFRDAILERVGLQLDAELRPSLFNWRVRAAIGSRLPHAQQSLTDLDVLRGFISGTGVAAIYDAIPIPIYLAACFAMHAWLGWFATAGLALVFMLAVLQTRTQSRRAAQLSGANVHNEALTDTFKNIEAVQALGMRVSFRRRWTSAYHRFLGEQAALEDEAALFSSVTRALTGAFSGLCMAIAAYLAIRGEISPGNVIGVMLIASKLLQPLGALSAEWPSFLRARQAYGRLQTLFRAAEAAPQRLALPRPEGHVEVSGLALT